MRTFQHDRAERTKPFVSQFYKGGMWWAQVYTTKGEYISRCFFTHAEALAKAYELAAMNKEASK